MFVPSRPSIVSLPSLTVVMAVAIRWRVAEPFAPLGTKFWITFTPSALMT